MLAMAALMCLAAFICLWCFCRVRQEQIAHKAMVYQALVAMNSNEDVSIWLASLKKLIAFAPGYASNQLTSNDTPRAGVPPVWKLIRGCLEDQRCCKALEEGQAAPEQIKERSVKSETGLTSSSEDSEFGGGAGETR